MPKDDYNAKETREIISNAYKAQEGMINKFTYAINYAAKHRVMGYDSPLTEEEKKANSMPETPSMEQSRTKAVLTDGHLLDDVTNYAFNGEKKANTIAGCRRAFELLGTMTAKQQLEIGINREKTAKTFASDKVPIGRIHKTNYMMVYGDLDLNTKVPVFEEMKKQHYKKLSTDKGVNGYIFNQMNAMLRNWKDISFDNMLNIMQITDPKAREEFLGKVGASPEDSVSQHLKEESEREIDPDDIDYVPGPEKSTEERYDDAVKSMIGHMKDAWVNQGINKADYAMTAEDKKRREIGAEMIDLSKKSLEMRGIVPEGMNSYENWEKSEGEAMAERKIKADALKFYKNQSKSLQKPKSLSEKVSSSPSKLPPVWSATVKDLYNILDDADPSFISSSKEFANMKKALLNLANVNRKEAPEKYQLLKDRAADSIKDYLRYKSKEIEKKGPNYKPSANTKKRFKTAKAILDRLDVINKVDFLVEGNKDKRFVVGNDMKPEDALKFINAQAVLSRGREDMLHSVMEIKAILASTQEHPSYNFENTEKMEGSDSYKEMTQSIQKTIDVLKNENATPQEVLKTYKAAIKKAKDYNDIHKGKIFGPLSDNGKLRQAQSAEMFKGGLQLVNTFTNLMREFEMCKDEFGVSYSLKPYSEIADRSDEALENNKEYFLKAKIPDYDKKYENIKEASGLQLELRSIVRKNNQFMVDNFSYHKNSDYYVALKEEPKLMELASDYVAYKYMNEGMKLGVKSSKVQNLIDGLKNGGFEKEVKKLAKDPVFKASVQKHPGKCFSEYEKTKAAMEKQKVAEKTKNVQAGGMRV